VIGGDESLDSESQDPTQMNQFLEDYLGLNHNPNPNTPTFKKIETMSEGGKQRLARIDLETINSHL